MKWFRGEPVHAAWLDEEPPYRLKWFLGSSVAGTLRRFNIMCECENEECECCCEGRCDCE